MRVAALYDIHGNLPALDAVLAEVAAVGADRIVVGGDVVAGPMPRETLARLLDLDPPVDFAADNVLDPSSGPSSDAATGSPTRPKPRPCSPPCCSLWPPP